VGRGADGVRGAAAAADGVRGCRGGPMKTPKFRGAAAEQVTPPCEKISVSFSVAQRGTGGEPPH